MQLEVQLEFWAIAAALVAIVALFLIRPLIAGRRAAASRADHDMAVFRDQLAAVDADLDRGVLSPEEAESARAEVSRRLLAAAAEAERSQGAGPAPAAASRLAAALAAVLLLGGGAGLYLVLGSPGAEDLPREARLERIKAEAAKRPGQEEAEARIAARRKAAGIERVLPPEAAEFAAMVDRVREYLEKNPEDVRARKVLARALMQLDDPAAAWREQQAANDLAGDAVTTEDMVLVAEAMVLAAEGYVSPEAESLLTRVLEREPRAPVARYYAGMSLAQSGRPDLTLKLWTELLREGPPDAPWIAPILRVIGEVAQAAGEQPPQAAFDAAEALRAARAENSPAPGGALPGPDAEAMRAAQDMSPEERREMVEGMVARLEDRLAEAGGPPEQWIRLIRAYGVLGRGPEEVERILLSAREAFAEAPEALAAIEAAGAAVKAAAGPVPALAPEAPATAPEAPAPEAPE